MAQEKLYEYQGPIGRLHSIRDSIRDRFQQWKENNPAGLLASIKNWYGKAQNASDLDHEDYSHLFRKKTRKELVRVSAAVMGIEFSYAAETAFVSPTLLKIGVRHERMTLVWALSPLLGLLLTPLLGSLSDRCPARAGRRRPFILLLAVGVLLGLLLVPNGEALGYALGDRRPPSATAPQAGEAVYGNSHPWGVFFTVLGTVLLDFDADACQSPARAYLLDVTIPEDHARGLSTFTIMAGLGGFFGYALGGINWDVTFLGSLLGGHVRAVFTLITIIFVVCVSCTLTSFKEMPLSVLELTSEVQDDPKKVPEEEQGLEIGGSTYGSVKIADEEIRSSEYQALDGERGRRSVCPADASLGVYLKSIIFMPYSIRMVCLTNLFCWMAHVCYSLYFTDFVGEAVFNGNPTGLEGSKDRELYESGVRFGCWGMSMYSLSCACYSTIIEKLIKKYSAKWVYVGGLLVYSTGMCLMALTKHQFGVILFSWTAGVMYSTLFTMPYLLVAHYHAKGTFEVHKPGEDLAACRQIRGLGTDVAIVSSMVFLAQFLLSVCMGAIVSAAGTTTAVVAVASALAFCGAISATQIVYFDL